MPIPSDPPRPRSRRSRRHADAVIQAEVRRLARALTTAADADKIRRLPANVYTVRDTSPEPAQPRGS